MLRSRQVAKSIGKRIEGEHGAEVEWDKRPVAVRVTHSFADGEKGGKEMRMMRVVEVSWLRNGSVGFVRTGGEEGIRSTKAGRCKISDKQVTVGSGMRRPDCDVNRIRR